MLQRYAKCPVCSVKTVLKFDESLLSKAKRFPYLVKVKHKDHYFYINLDSKAHVTDILHPNLVE